MLAEVEHLQLFIGLFVRQNAFASKRFLGVGGAVKGLVVQQDELAVFRQMHIKLEDVHGQSFDLHAVFERHERIFGRNTAAQTVRCDHGAPGGDDIRIARSIRFIRHRHDRVTVIVRDHKIKHPKHRQNATQHDTKRHHMFFNLFSERQELFSVLYPVFFGKSTRLRASVAGFCLTARVLLWYDDLYKSHSKIRGIGQAPAAAERF